MLDNPTFYISLLIGLALAVHFYFEGAPEKNLRKRDVVSLYILLVTVPAIFMGLLIRLMILLIKG